MNAPMPPSIRLEQQVLTLCETFWRGHGTDAHTCQGMSRRAAIWAVTGRKPTLSAFEEVLEAIHERDRINSNSIGLWSGEREVWPNDLDYAATKAEHLDVQDGMIRLAVKNLIP